MVKQVDKQKLDSLLEAGAITPKEYGYLLKDAGLKDREKFEKREKPSLGKNILSFIFTGLCYKYDISKYMTRRMLGKMA